MGNRIGTPIPLEQSSAISDENMNEGRETQNERNKNAKKHEE
jgi:hypothetical protein